MDDRLYDDALKLEAAVSQLQSAISMGDPIAGLNAIRLVHERLPDVAGELCLAASRAGFTNKRIANSLGVTRATLRGLREEARA